MFVKICGITNPEDALAAVDAGARALGFIFYPASPRAVTPENLAAWVGRIPAGIWKVGVFVNEVPERIDAVAAALSLDIAQLHGTETPSGHPKSLRVWKAFRVSPACGPDADYPADALLLDGPGAGQTFDWSVAAGIRRPLVLAGGLNEGNIQEAIERTNPWGVDVSSAVETSPGRKNHQRMKSFIQAALRT